MDIFQSQPDRLYPGLAVALTSEEAAQAGDLAQHLVQSWRRRWQFVTQQVGHPDFVGIEEQKRVQVGASSAQSHQMGDAPCHDEIQGERALDPFNRAKLERLDPAGVSRSRARFIKGIMSASRSAT